MSSVDQIHLQSKSRFHKVVGFQGILLTTSCDMYKMHTDMLIKRSQW